MRDRLINFDTCVLSDALDALGRPGATSGFHRWGPKERFCGRVRTVALQDGPGESRGPHLAAGALSTSGPGDVIVVSNQGRVKAGAWGGLLTLLAETRGVEGIVVDGALRDADEIEAGSVPVSARGVTPLTARGRYHEIGTDVPIRVDEIEVRPGDWVVADGSGLVFVAESDLEEVLRMASDFSERESRFAEELVAGLQGTEVLGSEYESMVRREEERHGP